MALWNLTDDLDRLALSPFYVDPSIYYQRSHPYTAVMPRHNSAPHHHMVMPHQKAGPICPIGKDGFQVSMDVTQFKPSELHVKVVDNSVVVEGKHEEREDDHGYISRHFVRRYTLPKNYEAEGVQSTLSSDGVLTVTVPKPVAIEDKSKERVVQIQQVGPAHLNVKENPKIESK